MAHEATDITNGPETEFLAGSIAQVHLPESIAPAWFANGDSSSDSGASDEDSDDVCPVDGSKVVNTACCIGPATNG